MTTTSPSSSTTTPVPAGVGADVPATSAARVGLGTVLAIAAGAAVTAAVALVARGLGASPEFAPLQASSFLPAVVVGVLLGTVGWAVVRRVASRPAAVLRVLVPTVVGLSLVPDALLLVTDDPGVGPGAVAALMVVHVLVAAVAVPVLARVLPVLPARLVDGP